MVTSAGDVIDVKLILPAYDAMLAKFNHRTPPRRGRSPLQIVAGAGSSIHPKARAAGCRDRSRSRRLDFAPAGTLHWFDLCETSHSRHRLFSTDKSGWTPHYTSSADRIRTVAGSRYIRTIVRSRLVCRLISTIPASRHSSRHRRPATPRKFVYQTLFPYGPAASWKRFFENTLSPEFALD